MDRLVDYTDAEINITALMSLRNYRQCKSDASVEEQKQYTDGMRHALAEYRYNKLFLNGAIRRGVTEEQIRYAQSELEECSLAMFR